MGKTLIKVKNQQGMVSFIVTLVLMLVITLIVIGFSQISRREQRQALDRQLSTQAFYAAESGVNDAIKAIHNNYVGDGSGNKTSCGADATGTFSGANYGVIDSGQNIGYTCLLINQGSVNNLSYSPIHAGKAISADMKFVNPGAGPGPANAQDIYFKWSVPAKSTQYPNFPASAAWTVLRVTVTDLTGANPYTRDNLNNNSFTTYLYPGGSSAATVTFNGQGSPAGLKAQGQIINADCSAGTSCTAGIKFAPALNHVFVRVTAIYADTNLTITADNPPGTPLNIIGAQAIVDVTGKAQDVLRRIQVRVPGSAPADLPSDFTVQSVSGICKQLLTNSTSSSDSCP